MFKQDSSDFKGYGYSRYIGKSKLNHNKRILFSMA